MGTKRKAGFIQAIFGAMVLSALMQPMFILGYGAYVWMLFLPLILFFALGVNFKLIPSMILSFACGIVWAMVNGVLMGGLGKVLPMEVAGFLAPVILIFFILTIHENFLGKTIVGNIPSLFMGMAQTFFVFSVVPSNASALNPFYLILFFIYGMILSVILTMGGFALCNRILGKEWIASGDETPTTEAIK